MTIGVKWHYLYPFVVWCSASVNTFPALIPSRTAQSAEFRTFQHQPCKAIALGHTRNWLKSDLKLIWAKHRRLNMKKLVICQRRCRNMLADCDIASSQDTHIRSFRHLIASYYQFPAQRPAVSTSFFTIKLVCGCNWSDLAMQSWTIPHSSL